MAEKQCPTTFDSGHRHTAQVDDNGNGVTLKDDTGHIHQVRNLVALPGNTGHEHLVECGNIHIFLLMVIISALIYFFWIQKIEY